MKFLKWLGKVFVLTSIATLFVVWWSFTAGYRLGQQHAVQGIYGITQEERDALDPDGKQHHLIEKP